MWEFGFVLALSLAGQPQSATLESCEFVEERWVCRYRLPDIQLVGPESSPPVTLPVPLPSAQSASPDPGVLTDAESALVARCAAAGWFSLCSPSQRTEARRLRDQAAAYEQARLRVGELIRDGQCDAALSEALGGGYLGLAREARALCPAGAGASD